MKKTKSKRRPSPQPAPVPTPARLDALSLALAALAIAMLAYRFLNLDLAVFINDEPRLLLEARKQLETGVWATHGLQGTQGVAYGPFATWFYAGVQALFGGAPVTSIFALCLIVTLAHVALAAGLARAFDGGLRGFATIAAFLASSPYLFFWSRMCWDNPLVNAFVALAIAVLVFLRGWRAAVLLGLLLGAALSTHLMVVPFAGLSIGVLALREGWRRGPLLAGAALLVALAINLPYLIAFQGAPSSAHAGGLSNLPVQLAEPVRVASLRGIDYFLDDAWSDLLASAGAARALVATSTVASFILAIAGAAALAAHVRASWIARLALALWIGTAVLHAARALDLHPHYQQAAYWVVPAGLAAALGWARRRGRGARLAAHAIVWAVALAQLAFIVSWMGYVRDRDGTQGLHYATPVASQERAVRELCAGDANPLVFANRTRLFPHALGYLTLVEPACRGRRVLLCHPGSCPAGARTLRYAAAVGGALTVEE